MVAFWPPESKHSNEPQVKPGYFWASLYLFCLSLSLFLGLSLLKAEARAVEMTSRSSNTRTPSTSYTGFCCPLSSSSWAPLSLLLPAGPAQPDQLLPAPQGSVSDRL